MTVHGHTSAQSHTLHVDMGQTDKVLEEYDNVLQYSAVEDNAFGLIDATSLLWRLEVSQLSLFVSCNTYVGSCI